MKNAMLFGLLLSVSSNCYCQSTDTISQKKKDPTLQYTIKLGYLFSTNHWTQIDQEIPSFGYTSKRAGLANKHQISNGLTTDFELRMKHLGFTVGLHFMVWNDSIHGTTYTNYYHPKAPPDYPILAHYASTESVYSAKGIEIRARIGLNYWIFKPNNRYNLGIGMAYNPRIVTRQTIRNMHTDSYYIYEIGPYGSNPGSKTETWTTSDEAPVVMNQLNSAEGFFRKWPRKLDLSASLLARISISRKLELETTIGYRFQSRSRITYYNFQQDAGLFGHFSVIYNF